MKCRHCRQDLNLSLVDLGFAPPSNSYLSSEDLSKPEKYYPLKVLVCEDCWLVQTEDYAQADELFESDYAYFSSTSTSWLKHAEGYVRKIIEDIELTPESFVVELASNDGYLLKNFVTQKIPCLGVEPTDSTADAAEALGIPVVREFFSEDLADELVERYQKADLIIANNVYAHVPDINDFTKGVGAILKKGGVVTIEFPHLFNLLHYSQFDTIYHEHYSYLSLYSVNRIFEKAGLKVFKVEELSTHGGSLRVYGCHIDDNKVIESSVGRVLEVEYRAGLQTASVYDGFQQRVNKIKDDFLGFLLSQKKQGKRIVAYGAAAKGNTLINYAGIKTDLIDFVVDGAKSKQGKFLPGSHIPILSPQVLTEEVFDCVVILPWNIASEIKSHVVDISHTGCRCVVAIPEIKEI